MRVHPSPRKREISPPRRCGGRQRKLRRLPHVFGRVLELPFSSDADVHVLEDPTAFRFSAPTAGLPHRLPLPVRARAIDIHPGVTKVVIREVPPSPPSLSEHDDEEVQEEDEEEEEEEELLVEDLEVDRWRFRLPAGTRPELATASYADGELVVVVPKGAEDDGDDGGGLNGTGGGIRRLVIVQ